MCIRAISSCVPLHNQLRRFVDEDAFLLKFLNQTAQAGFARNSFTKFSFDDGTVDCASYAG